MKGFVQVTNRKRKPKIQRKTVEELGECEAVILEILKRSEKGMRAVDIAKHEDLKKFEEGRFTMIDEIGHYLYETPLKFFIEKSSVDHLWRAKKMKN